MNGIPYGVAGLMLMIRDDYCYGHCLWCKDRTPTSDWQRATTEPLAPTAPLWRAKVVAS